MPSVRGASHIAVTVPDMAASAEWYQRAFGWQVLRRYDDEAGTPRILLTGSTTSRSGWSTSRNSTRGSEDPDGIQLELWLQAGSPSSGRTAPTAG